MNKKNFFVFAVTAALMSISSSWAFVQAEPAFYDFGSVKAGGSSSAAIWFRNYDNQTVQNFFVNCIDASGGDFMCNSFCYSIPPYGSCGVTVWFYPRRGDNSMVWLDVQGSAPGVIASSHLQGIDSPRN